MPIYEYACKGCDHRWEVLQRSASQAAPVCPVCGEVASEKVPTAAVMVGRHSGGNTCCGRDERCAAPPCGSGGCHRH